MIQELFGGAAGERKISNINEGGTILLPSPNTCLLSPSSTPQSITATSTTAATSTAATSNSSENQNLRCPRCDSPNTKFCYYNNYNLTQPRHFCKTCRRYWTKGGALRNVPIGGGCRKNKNAAVSNSVAKAATATKMKAVVASELGRSSGILGQPLFDHHDHLPPTPILWGSPQNTHLLSLLRAGQNPNPNPSPSPMSISNAAVKEEGNLSRSQSQSHMVTNSEPLLANGVVLNNNVPRTVGYDAVAVGHVTSSQGLCGSFWRNNNQEIQIQQQNSGFVQLGEHQSSGIQEFYHRLRSSSVNYNCSDNNSPTTFLGNMASSSSSSLSNMLESSSVSGTDQFGCWNPTLNWSDLPTTNGAYP